MNLIEPIHEHAKNHPNSLAIITSEQNISWSDLDNLIWSTAVRLCQFGLNAGDRVAISMFHPVIHLVTSLSLARIGVAHISIPVSETHQLRNERYTKLNLKTIISDVEQIVAATRNSLLLNKLAVCNISPEQKEKICSVDGNLTWLILQSSGTTSHPKFAELSHNGAIERLKILESIYHWNREDILWTAIQLDFVSAKQITTFGLGAGICICLPLMKGKFSDVVKFIDEKKVTLGHSIPSTLHKLVELNHRLPNMRAMLTGSSTVNMSLRRLFKEKICSNLIVNYGTNEAYLLTTTETDDHASENGLVGKPRTGIEISIIDETENKVENGVTGEIKIRGSGIVDSYLNGTEATTKSFKDGWFYPGDLGYLTQEGALVLQGRKDDMMIFDGMNIYPSEIENVLSSHPAVNEVAAFALKHEKFQDVPVAAVTLKKEAVTEIYLIEFCKIALGIKYPRRIFILQEFPRNQMGKILKRELSSVVWKINN